MPKSRRRKPKQQPFTPIHPRAEEILRAQQAEFRKKFGRDPGPGDPVFFDPDVDEPAPFSQVRMEAETLDAMRRAGAPPQILYASRKTGLIVTESSKDHIPADRRAEWDSAIDEYFMIEDAKANRAPGWDTEITELLVSGLDKEGLEHVHACLRAVGPVEGSQPMNLAARIELAAHFVAGALGHAFDAAHATGTPEGADDLFEMTADLVIRRAH